MEENSIKKYAKLMQDLDLTGLEISENGKTVRLERAAPIGGAAVRVTAPGAASEALAPIAAPDPGLVSIPSPMVGVFYAAPAQNQPSFVSVNDRVRKGDVLCIIESMKLMNEILSEHDGVLAEICVSNQQVVEYGQALFRIRKETP
ncbi:MAG TPA: acetyl-CoA carboxylase, biotin carboxyl carrier protein [Clostridiales bacterium]|nr:acetyl-CoA carboxylase, biotin carboxyl carrier protein [Clostridiales bacterium]HBR09084.1 acetyl-CoA carboxylase, biotin carboxyl carrier protein [Clostridiales bacterium]